ncbi:MAG: outer membrane beta-barrel protein [Pseudarcicella sp.]|nr:outer membrane beta-barrel protein [Pseudarcicella sp.]
MKINRILLLALILSFSVLKSFSQVSFEGIVLDSATQKPLKNAYIKLQNKNDSTIVFMSKTSQSGIFVFKQLPQASYSIKTTYVGYEANYWSLDFTLIKPQKYTIFMHKSSQELEEVVIVSKVQTVVQKQDTLQFSSKAFKVNPDANADELIEKMPGTTIESGKLNVQGEEVKQVMIDGKLYFGKDATAAMKNLPAEVIDKIQVFDQQSEQSQLTGVDDGNTTKTINIITKPDMRNGIFGRNHLGIGTNKTYKFSSSINRFMGDSKLTVLAQTNNVNQQNFASEDLVGLSSTASSSSRKRSSERTSSGASSHSVSDNSSNFLVGNQDGYNITNAIGLNYSNEWKSGIKLQGSYFFNNATNDLVENSFRQYFITEAQKISTNSSRIQDKYTENNYSITENYNHRAYARIEWQVNDKNTFIFTPNFSYQTGVHDNRHFGLYQLLDSSFNKVSSDQNSTNDAYVWSNNAMFRHKFGILGRSLVLNFSINGNDKLGDKYMNSEGVFPLKQFSNSLSNSIGYGTTLYYSEPLSQNVFGFISAAYSTNTNESNKRASNFDESVKDYTVLDSLFSNVFDSDYSNYRLGTGFRKVSKVFYFSAEIRYQQAVLNNQQFFPALYQLEQKSFSNLLPSLSFRYNIDGKNKSLKFNYQTTTHQPTIAQLQEVRNNTNLLKLSIGNSNLKQEYQHQVTFRYTSTNPKNFASYVALLSGSIVKDHIANTTSDTFLLNRDKKMVAGQIVRPINMNGQYSIKAFTSFGFPLKLIKSNLNTNLTSVWARLPGFINKDKNISFTQKYTMGVVLSSNISSNVDFTLSSNTNINLFQNSIAGDTITKYNTQQYKAKLNVIFPYSFLLNIEATNISNSGLSDSFNQNFTLLNIAIAKKFLAKKQAEIRLSVFDLLNMNKSIDRHIVNNFTEDMQSNVLKQYFMLTLSYNLKKYYKQ